MVRRSVFTLVEIIVVLVIIMMITGIAVASLRGESPAVTLNRTSLEFEAFLARVRFLCAESGRDYLVHFYPDRKLVVAHVEFSEEEKENMEYEITESPKVQRFSFGDEIELFTVEAAEESGMEEEYIELFRFYQTGGASCINRLGLRVENLSAFFDISFFNGQLIRSDGDGIGVEKR